MEKNRRYKMISFLGFLAGLLVAFILGFQVGHGDFRDYDYEVTFEGEQVEARVRFNLPYTPSTEIEEATECLLDEFFSRLDGIMNIPSEHNLEQPQDRQDFQPSPKKQSGATSLPLT